MADVVYNSALEDLADGLLTDGSDLWIMLVTSSYTPDPDNHNVRSNVTNEVTGTGYTSGGIDLGTITVTRDDANNRVLFDAADPVWPSSTITARGAVIYRKVGTAGTDRLVCYLDFGSDVSSTAAAFTVQLNSAGFLAIASA